VGIRFQFPYPSHTHRKSCGNSHRIPIPTEPRNLPHLYPTPCVFSLDVYELPSVYWTRYLGDKGRELHNPDNREKLRHSVKLSRCNCFGFVQLYSSSNVLQVGHTRKLYYRKDNRAMRPYMYIDYSTLTFFTPTVLRPLLCTDFSERI